MKKIIAVTSLALLVSCGEKNEVSWKTQEMQRAIAIENSEYNAKAFRLKTSPMYDEYNIMGRGDSTISAKCANGDGWASVDLVHSDGTKIPIKCSTASSTIGCMTKKDFLSRPYASEEGNCNKKLPIPMPKIKN